MSEKTSTKEFEKLLFSIMNKRLFISITVLITFLGIIGGIGFAISMHTEMAEQWKELLLLLLGAFIGSYGKIIDYWFKDNDKDKMLVQKMDEEDGVSLSDTSQMDLTNPEPTPIIPEDIQNAMESTPQVAPQFTTEDTPQVAPQVAPQVGVEIDEDGDGTMDGIDKDGDGDIDEYFAHRYCDHVWGDKDGDGQEECLVCGIIKEN
jgi:hypothetical protein